MACSGASVNNMAPALSKPVGWQPACSACCERHTEKSSCSIQHQHTLQLGYGQHQRGATAVLRMSCTMLPATRAAGALPLLRQLVD